MDYSHVTLKKFTWSTRQHILDGFHETLAYYEEQGFKPAIKAGYSDEICIPNAFDLLYLDSCIRFTVAQFSFLDIPKPYPCASQNRGRNRIDRKLTVMFYKHRECLDEMKEVIRSEYLHRQYTA